MPKQTKTKSFTQHNKRHSTSNTTFSTQNNIRYITYIDIDSLFTTHILCNEYISYHLQLIVMEIIIITHDNHGPFLIVNIVIIK